MDAILVRWPRKKKMWTIVSERLKVEGYGMEHGGSLLVAVMMKRSSWMGSRWLKVWVQ